MTMRFAKRRSEDGYWRVTYVATGQVVVMDGNPLEDLEEREAEEVLDLLEAGELEPDRSDKPMAYWQ